MTDGTGMEMLLAVARRDAILATASARPPTSIRELVLLETGAFDRRGSRHAEPSPGAIAALAYLHSPGLESGRAVTDTHSARELIGRLGALHELDRGRIRTLGKAAASSHRVHHALERWPIASATRIIETTGLQVQAVTSALHRLRGLGIVREITRRHRHRLYSYDAWLTLLDADVERWLNPPEAAP